jgi:hypothetical protein
MLTTEETWELYALHRSRGYSQSEAWSAVLDAELLKLDRVIAGLGAYLAASE